MTNTPNLENRRTRATVKPSPDEHIDPIETTAVKPAPTQPARKPVSAQAEGAQRALNLQVSEEVAQTIDFAKFKTKLSKRAIVEQAVLAHWAKYTPEQQA